MTCTLFEDRSFLAANPSAALLYWVFAKAWLQ